MSFEIFAQTIVNGLFTGAIYAMVAIGLTLIYGVMIIMNFAHGEFLMLGMYVAYWGFVLAGLDPYVSIPIAAILVFILGALIQRGFIQRVLDAHPLNQIILLLGISTLITGLVQFFFTAEPLVIRVPYETEVWKFLGMRFNIPRTVAFLSSMVIAILLYLFLQFSKTGKAIRAVSQNRDASSLMGINVKWIYMLTFGLGAAVTAIGGVLLTPNYKLIPTIGQSYSVIAFVVVVLGTMGNFLGALLGGLIIGLVEAFAGYFIGGDLKIVASMFVFILILLFKPSGLFGKKMA
ncbi:MAG TPA: branched-chain amino acid ABC transporter permease [Anaerolineales bacterium]|nr:branched-chain amino acid ABC transporter permease [Anaerolineales bacterium]